MNLKSLLLGLVSAVCLGAAGYGIYAVGVHRGQDKASGAAVRQAGPAGAGAGTLPAASPDAALPDPAPLSISQGEEATRRHMAAGIRAGDVDPSTGKKILYYHDPMVPGNKFDQPAKSPFMDMMLVPVYAESGGDASSVTVSSRTQQNLGVRTAAVTEGTLSTEVSAVGNIAFNERNQVVVQARATGYIERMHVRATLDRVAKGQPLAELYVPDWIAAQEEFLSLRRMKGGDLAPLIEGARLRMRQVGMNDEQIALVETSGLTQPRIKLVAPISGVVTELMVREGMTVMPGATLFRLNGLSTVWANAEVPESQSALLRPGAKVQAKSPAAPGTIFEGKVQAVLPEVDPATRTLKVRLELRNPGYKLVPGMFVQMQFADQRAVKSLLVPTESIIETGRRTVVLLAEENGRFRPVDVEIGIESGGQTQIKRGLEAGQRVVVSSQFLIDSEASLRGVEARLNATPQPDPSSAALRHRGEGKVEAIGPDAVTLSHGPIDTMKWGAMTMDFKLPPAGLPRAPAPGDRVSFEFYIDAESLPQLTIASPLAPETGARSATPGGRIRWDEAVIALLIRWSIANRFLVLLATLMITAWGVISVLRTPLDALPDLSDVQVIIRTTYPGQAPRIVENQITYPMTTTMLSVPGAKTVRGYSFFGDSFVYVLFEDGTDLYWARSRVLEYLNQVQSRLPPGAKATLGPDATGVGWIYQYALVDRGGTQDAGQLRALQDWFLRYELKTVPNVAEVASVGGMVRQYQVVLNPDKLAAYGIAHTQVIDAIQKANQEAGGSVLELGEAEYMVRASGYLQSLDDFRKVPLMTTSTGVSVRLGDVARIQIGPEMRRGIGELNGEGEATGGVIVMRSGKNALETIAAVKTRLQELQGSLPKGVEVVPVYDRSSLIERAVSNLGVKLLEEFIVVAVVCFIFLFHLRSAFVAIVSLPLGILAAFIVMRYQGVNANIMSLGGIAIAIGAMVDAAVVMIENAHKHLERWSHEHPDSKLEGEARWKVIGDSAVEVGPALFFSLLIITLSFIPVFTLEAQEGRLFSPLAFTKTYAMAAAAGLSVTLIPVLMGYLIRGRIPDEKSNPLNRLLIALYRPLLNIVLRLPKLTLAVAALALVLSLWPVQHIGGEFMPRLDEGDLLYMPSALPGLSAGKAAELLQQTDRLIKTVPEVSSVYGKAGRAETATDPAPLEMFETTIQFKPREQWRPGMTQEKLIEELDRIVKVPGLANIWVPPIRNRIDMLATGIKSPVGVKVAGSDLTTIDRITGEIERVLKDVPGVSSALAERLTGGRYVDVTIDRDAAARFGMNIADVQSVITSAVGGDNIGETVEGLQRFPINVRYPREIRDSLEKLRSLPIVSARGARLVLGDLADIRITEGPPMLRSENARLSGWVYVDIRDRDLRSAVQEMQQVVADKVQLPAGYSISWSGQFEFLERATAKMKVVVPFTLLIVFVLLYLTFKRFDEALLVMATLPFAMVGGIWLLYLLEYNLSVASAVGFIALAGVSAEFGVIMLLYLKQAWDERLEQGKTGAADLIDAIREGAVLRVRPKAMTVAVILAGLFPIMWGAGTGSEVMQRIAAPMVGGMITAPLLSMFVIPAAYLLMRRPRKRKLPRPTSSPSAILSPQP